MDRKTIVLGVVLVGVAVTEVGVMSKEAVILAFTGANVVLSQYILDELWDGGGD